MKRQHKTPAPRPVRLFAEPAQALDESSTAHIANIDGAARGNPGPASYGVIIRQPDGRPLEELCTYLGHTTNNVAEYRALIAALDYAHAHGLAKLRVRSDSELLVRQMQRRYKVKSPALRPLHGRARKLAQGLAYFSIEHVPREQNLEADALANAALDRTRAGGATRLAADGGPLRASGRTPRADASTSPSRGLEARRIRARYSHGALHPDEPLDLVEGAEVEIIVERLRHT